MGIVQQSLTILGLSALIALLTTFTHPKAPTPPWRETAGKFLITLDQLPETESLLWVDARPESAFAHAHAPNALHLTEDNWDTAFIHLLEGWTPGTLIVVYCDARDCHASEAVAQRLRRDLGFDNVYYLEGGWEHLRTRLQ